MSLRFTATGIEATISNHLKVLFWEVHKNELQKLKYRLLYGYQLFVFVAVIMPGDVFAIISIYS